MSCHSHSHSDDHIAPPSTNEAQTLYNVIDLHNVKVFNAEDPDTAMQIIRPYERRMDSEPTLVSDADEELIITVPFTGLVKLHSVLMRSHGDDSSPKSIKLFKNNNTLDFDTINDAQCLQTLEYPEGIGSGISTTEGNDGIVQFAVNRPKFTNISSVTLHILSNYGAEQTALAYLGFRGDFTELKSAPVVAQYEAAANPKDHKIDTVNLETSGPSLN